MAIIRCENGHFYDDKKHKECPYCNKNHNSLDNLTMWQRAETEGIKTESFRIEKPKLAGGNEDLTVGVFSSIKGNDYVTGWLVCVEGPDKGRDYRLHHGFNRIGRDSGCDVTLENDQRVSRSAHCSIIYEDKKNCFYLMPEQGQLTYYKNELLEKPVLLSTYDIFEIGETRLQFVAFCGGDRKWDV